MDTGAGDVGAQGTDPGRALARRRLEALVLDLVSVAAFVLGGRASHDEGVLAGAAGTAWPFVAGLAIGWAGVVFARFDPWALRAGLLVWADTVVLGLVLRNLGGEGTPPSFVAVAAAVLGLLLLGWRLVASRAVARRR